jgi:hypothetical protein
MRQGGGKRLKSAVARVALPLRHWCVFVPSLNKRQQTSLALAQSAYILYTTSCHSSHIPVSTMAVDEATQTNGVPEPQAGQLKKEEVEQSKWSVESGML